MKGQKYNRNIIVRTGIVFLACVLVVSAISCYFVMSIIQKQKNQARYVAESATRRIGAQINNYLVVSDIMKKLIGSGYYIAGEDFAVLAELMKDDHGVIEAFEYAPGGVVSQVYPLEVNHEAIGLNLLEAPERKEEAALAATSGQYTIAEPFELAQGGTGALLLDPIYVTEESGEERFWGFSVLVLNWDGFLKEVKLENMEQSGYRYQIWHTSLSTGEQVIIAASRETNLKNPVQVACEVPNDVWHFEIVAEDGWMTWGQTAVAIVGTLLISLLSSFVYYQYAVGKYRRKLYQEELEKEAERANAASEAKTRFLFNMSHDIRTPMNAILGFANIARENLSDRERVEDSLEKIELAGRDLLSLINEILNISKIESGTMQPAMKCEDLRELSRTMKLLFEQPMAEKGVQFEVKDDLRQPFAICDMQHMREICVNLLSNAMKFTPKGGKVTFSVNQKEDEETGNSAYEVIVADTGIGMSEEFQKIQFELFEREQTRDVSQVEGTGLGLPIVKRLVDMLGGTIQCASRKNRGTTYTITFKLQPVDRETAEEEKTAQVQRPVDDFSDCHILLVEDNELNREIALYLLQNLKSRLDTAEDGQEAVEKVRMSSGDPFDLILMDVQMPRMNGYEATRTIRRMKDPALANTPIVAMTANAFDEDRENALNAGMNDHIAKPIEYEKLRAVLRDHLR